MNYQIIKDENKLREFIKWLPELAENEKYFVSLFARKKYCEDKIKSNDKTQLKRFTSNKERLFEKIKQLECEFGSYTLRNIEAPQESLVLYINPNPRDMKKATFGLMKKCIDLLQTNGNGYNVHAEALSCIQKSKSKSHFCDFDIDTKDIDLSKLNDILPKETYDILETRGGYHLLVKTRLAPKTKWHVAIREAFEVDQVGDQLIPVCGCYQGGYVPRFIPNTFEKSKERGQI
jgi:hypothetical protein